MLDNLIESNLDDLINGYRYNPDLKLYTCGICGDTFEEGEIFKVDDRYFTADRMAKLHLQHEHGDLLGHLMTFDKKYTGLTENQVELLQLIQSGLTDSEIARETGVKAATIRHQRFTFREKAKQAKLYLAIYELAFNGRDSSEGIIEMHSGAKMRDDRYCVTLEEEKQVLETMFSSQSPLKLKTFPARQKRKIIVLKKIAEQFETKRRYLEPELNGILKGIYDDFVTIRRYLIEYGFMERTNDCKEYWIK